MCVGGAHPAPGDLAPRIMDMLDGHLGIVFALALAVLRVEAPAISALHGEALVDALKAQSASCFRSCNALQYVARSRAANPPLTLGPKLTDVQMLLTGCP